MARNFVAASSHKLTLNRAVLTVHPLTMACWFKPVAANAAYNFMAIDDGSTSNSFSLQCGAGASAGKVRVTVNSSGTVGTSTSFSAGVWAHACGVFTSSTSRAVYLDGGGKQTNATDLTPSGVNATKIGFIAATTRFLDGTIAEAAIWNIDLTDAEVSMLAASKISPLLIRPDHLVAYWPLLGKSTFFENDAKGSLKNQMKNTGTLPVAHPPYPFYRPVNRKWKRYFVSAKVVAGLPLQSLNINQSVVRASYW